MESCQERTLGISIKVSELMSKIIQDMNLTQVGGVVLLKAAIPHDKTRQWPFGSFHIRENAPPSILFQKDIINH